MTVSFHGQRDASALSCRGRLRRWRASHSIYSEVSRVRSVTFGTTVSHAPASSIFRWKEGMVDLLDQLELLDPLSSTEAQQRVASLVRCALDIAVLWRWRLTSHLLPVYRTRRSSFSTLQRCTFGACRRAWPPAAAAHTCERARTHLARSAAAGRYLQVFRKLEESYDQMVHPQKRMDIRKVRSH